MARDAAKDFLNRKRREQAQREQNPNITMVIPSAASRYGLRHMMPDGTVMPGATHQGAMPARYMGNTGLGPDGKLQPNMPTHMMRTTQGPQMVHEGEDMYQQPGGQVQVIPASNVPQSRLAAMEAMYGIPGKQTGGIFTAQNQNADEEIGPYGKPTELVRYVQNQNADEEIGPYGKASDFTASDYAKTYNKPIAPPMQTVTKTGEFGGLTLPEPPKLPGVSGTGGGTGTFGTLKLPEPPKVDDSPPTTPVTSPAQYDEMVLNRYMNRMGAMTESERAAEAQRMLQTGASPDDVRAMQAQTDVSRRAAMGQAIGDFATDAAARAEQRAQFNRTQGFTERQWDEGKEQRDLANQTLKQSIGDQAYNALTNDINSGLTIDQIRTKDYNGDGQPDFPNFTDTQYSSIRDTGPLGTRDFSRMLQAGDYSGINQYLTSSGLPSIDFSKLEAGDYAKAAGDLESLMATLPEDADPQLIESISQMWLGVKKQQWGKLGVDIGTDAFQDTLTDIANSTDDADTSSKSWVDFTRYAQTALNEWTTTTDGVNAMVELSTASPEGAALTDIVDALAQSQEAATAAAKQAGFDSYEAALEEVGAVMGARFSLETNGTVTALQKTLLQKYGLYDESMSISPESAISPAELNSNIDTIKTAIEEGDIDKAKAVWSSLSTADKENYSKYAFLGDEAEPSHSSLSALFYEGLKPNARTDVQTYSKKGMGKVGMQMSFNSNIYQKKPGGASNEISFTPEFEKTIMNNKGNQITVQGDNAFDEQGNVISSVTGTYIIDPDTPIVKGYEIPSVTFKANNRKTTQTQKFFADAVRLIDPESGQVIYWTFNSKGEASDDLG